MQSPANTSTHLKRPLPRRKACGECFKSKRRCDQRLPACSRCSKQRLGCHYLVCPPLPRPIGSASDTANEADITPPHDDTPSPPQFPDGDIPDEDLSCAHELDLGFWNETFVPAAQNPPVAQHPSPPADILQWIPNTNPLAELGVPDPISSDLFNVATSRLNYAIEMMKAAPSRMVLENSTPWCHPLLYHDQMPKSMNDAYAACAMYMAKNDVNKRMIFRGIEARAKELLRPPHSTMPIEVLARVQSLVLYQVIRLYDGDIRLRAQGEADMDELEKHSYVLLGLLDGQGMSSSQTITEEPHFAPRSPPPLHSTWIFQESCRRTCLLSFYLISFYALLKDGSCMRGVFAAARPWTFNAHLWNATSEFDFKVAWREKNHFMIRNLEFDEVLTQACPEDVEDFGKAFLVLIRGLDDIREWFYKKGGKFT